MATADSFSKAASTSAPALPAGGAAETLTYEERLASNPRWALMEGSLHFDESNEVFKTLRRIVTRLEELGVPYAVVGGLALFHHGYRRFTEGVDLLIDRADLKRIHKRIHDSLSGLGYLPPHQYSKNLRDTQSGVRIEFLLSGDYPGNGKPKAIAFPSPVEVSEESDGTFFLDPVTLVELKLASGASNKERAKDLIDVQQLIKSRRLPRDFADQLDASVRSQYFNLWNDSQTRFVTLLDTTDYQSDFIDINAFIIQLGGLAKTLEDLAAEGVAMEPAPHLGEGKYLLVTTDPDVAAKYDFVEETEFWVDDSSPSE